MSRDRLYLIEPGFSRPNHPPSERFACPACNVLEGLLASGTLAPGLEVHRVPFQRPRAQIVALLGEANQGLPALVLGDEHPVPADAREFGGVRFFDDEERIAQLLAQRHGFFRL